MVFKKHRRHSGRFVRTARRFAKRGGMGKTTNIIQLDAMAYGAARSYVSQLIAPLTSKIPIVGNLSDEVGMGLVDWLLAKNTHGFISEVAKKGLVIENARVGEGIVGGVLGGMFGGSSNNSALSSYNSGFAY
jgi:hypothetical protein